MESDSDSLRVLFIIPAFWRNGAVEFIVDLADELALLRMKIEIFTFNKAKAHSRLPQQPIKTSVALETSQFRRHQLLYVLIKLIWPAASSDIIVLTWENGPFIWIPSLVAYVLRKPTVAIVQNNIQRSLVDYAQCDEKSFGRRALRWSYAQARAVVCVSEALIASVEQEVGRQNVTAIPNGIDVERIRKLGKFPPPSMLMADDQPIVLGLGRLAPQKGFDLLIRAHAAVLKRGIQHRLVLVGEGPEAQALLQLSAELGIAESVIFLGYLPEPYSALACASLFCLSSRYEGFPLVLMETAVLGVPVVAADCLTGPREILADGLYGDLVEPESVGALSSAIERHFRDPARLRGKAQASASQADRFSMRTCAQKYSRLLRQHGGKPGLCLH